MKYKKLLKKAAVSLLLAQSLIFTGLPIQAADIAGQGMVWTERAEMEMQETLYPLCRLIRWLRKSLMCRMIFSR